MATLMYPTQAEISLVAQDYLADLTQADPVFGIMPIATKDSTLILWEQEDYYGGLQQIRGLGGAPPKVQPIGLKQYQMTPGVYGEQLALNEREMMERSQYGTLGTPINVDDLVMRRTKQLLVRELQRIKQINWALLSAGTFSVSTQNGAVAQTDTYPLQTFAAAVPWATFATATPLADLSAVALLWAGHSVSFGRDATVYMNRTTFTNMRQNNNTADLYGRRTGGFGTYNTEANINELLTGDDLPSIQLYDKGYYNDAGTFTRFIPNGKAVVVGVRDDGGTIGNYLMTRTAGNPDFAPGPYTKIVDNATPGSPEPVPREIVCHRGHSGGPVIYFPSAIVVMTVS